MTSRDTDDDVPAELDPPALAARLGVSLRTLRSWIRAGVLPSPPPGPRPVFSRAVIIRAHAIAQLRRDGIGLPQIATFLKKKRERELREIGGLGPARPSGPPKALPRSRPRPALPAESSASREPSSGALVPPGEDGEGEGAISVRATLDEHGGEPSEEGTLAGSEWRRIELLPGLELHVRKDASPFVQGLAAAIAAGRFAK